MSLEKRRLSWQQPIQAKGKERFVYSYNELINAISDAQSDPDGYRSIYVVHGITLPQGIIIPVDCTGLAIYALNNTWVLSTSFSTNYVFSILASNVTIDGVRFDSVNVGTEIVFAICSGAGLTAPKLTRNVFLDGDCFCRGTVVDVGGPSQAIIANNIIQERSGGTNQTLVTVSSYCAVLQNIFGNVSGNNDVVCTNSFNSFIGNSGNGGTFSDTSANGLNVLGGNYWRTRTLNANDFVDSVVRQVEIDFGTTPVSEGSFQINDNAINPSSRVFGHIAYDAPTGKDIDELEMDSFDLKFGQVVSGQCTLYIKSLEGDVADKFKVNYTVGY